MTMDFLPEDKSPLNLNIARKYGLDVSALLGYMISVDKKSEHKDRNPWFHLTIEEIEENIGMKRRKQEKAIKKLEELGMIEKKVMGLPPKRHFKINYERVQDIIAIEEELDVSLDWGRE